MSCRGLQNHVNQMARLTDLELDVGAVPVRRDPRKFTMCEYLTHNANVLRMKNSLMRLNGNSAVYLPGD